MSFPANVLKVTKASGTGLSSDYGGMGSFILVVQHGEVGLGNWDGLALAKNVWMLASVQHLDYCSDSYKCGLFSVVVYMCRPLTHKLREIARREF